MQSLRHRWELFVRQTDFSSSHSSSMLDANFWTAVLTFQVVFFFMQRSSSFSLASASPVQHDNESWYSRQRAYLTNTFFLNYTLNSYDGLVRGLLCSRKIQYRNIVRRSSLLFLIFFRQSSCRPFQSIKTSMRQPLIKCIWMVQGPGLPHNALHFPRMQRQTLVCTCVVIIRPSWSRCARARTRVCVWYEQHKPRQ